MKKFQHALVTGASRGLGRAIAIRLAPRCAQMTLLGRDQVELEKTRSMIRQEVKSSVQLEILICDVSQVESLRTALKNANDVDLLINNAGLGALNHFAQMSEEQIHQMISVNMTSLTWLCSHFAKLMKSRGSGQIINIASVAAFLPIPYFSVYAATKAYVLSLSVGLDHELKSSGVRVKALCPGGIATDFYETARISPSMIEKNKFAIATSDFVAQAAIDLIESESNIKIPGWVNQFLALLARGFSRNAMAATAARSYRNYILN